MTATDLNLSTQYDPAVTEARWQEWWEGHQVFQADPERGGKPYCVVIPPPNVTGSLHMGHAFESTLIDVLVRYHRMKGYNTLWLPGTDHASIAVQTILEKQLKAEGKARDDLGRVEFLRRAWEWKAESGGTIVNQLRRLGVSVDWSRERFTLDAGLSKAVLAAFVQLYEAGLIYRGKYLVNWCPATQSAVSDLEVENQEVEGHLWHFRYPLTQGAGSVEVATTRPETMLGDTAVAVHPDDTRYQHLIGQTVTLPILNREIPIIGDQWVDPGFGTGCVKVTPAHDPNDFEIGQRHELPMINILNKDGSLNENAGPFQGQDRFVARPNVVQQLEAEGFLVKVENYRHTVPYSDRGKVPVEPLLSTQWFVKIRPLADRTLEFLDQKQQPAFVPQRWSKVYRDWLVSLKDWCISRQLWWGHQIPAWYAVSQTGGEITDQTPFLVAATQAEAQAQAEAKFGPNVELQQDPDVLDTWFSSGLWPFSTLGWPEQTEDLAFYYPTTTLVTGFDIIFFWVARMTMMGVHFTGQMPFQTVYIHGLVRDENNKKMSKSANNGIDPLVLIKKYGTDALRYTLIREVAGAGQDIRLEYDRKKAESPTVEASRNFANKLWNASRFVMLNLDGLTPEQLGQPRVEALELSDRWILSRFYQAAHQTSNWIDNYGLGEAAKGLYEFIWGDFCDWYIELVKSRLQGSEGGWENDSPNHLREATSKQAAQQTLAYVLEGTLKLLHPFMPHVTEEIWHTLTQVGDEQSLALQAYPEADPELINPELEQQFELIIGTIRTVRNLRAEAGIKPGVKIQTILQSESDRDRQTLTGGQSYIQGLARVEKLTIAGTPPPLPTEKQISTSFLSRNKQTRISVGLILTAVILLVLAQAVLTTLSYIPLLPSICELIGFGYSTWFVIRYLLGAAERQGLSEEVQVLKEKIIGKGLPDSHSQSQYPDKSQQQMFAGVVGTVQVLIPLAGVVDVEALRTKLEKDLSKVETDIKSFSGRLNNSGFVDKAPPEVVQGARNTLAEAKKQAEILRDRLVQLR